MAEVLAPASDAPAPAVSVIDIDTIAPIDFSEADAQFFAELSAAAADFNPQAMAAPPAADIPVVAGTEGGFEAGFDDDAENIDEDIREVFLEEFDDELANLGTLLPAWRVQLDNMDRLRPIRRIFHTLKGSGRLVGRAPWASSPGRSKACSTACLMAAARPLRPCWRWSIAHMPRCRS